MKFGGAEYKSRTNSPLNNLCFLQLEAIIGKSLTI